MNKKEIKEAFQKDIESCSMLNNNLSFEQIRDKIEIKDRRRQEDNYKKYFPNWRLISSIVGIVLVFSMSLLYFNLSKTAKYKESPFAEQLDGDDSFKKDNYLLDSIYYNQNFSTYLDMQENSDISTYFYDIEIKKEDDFYTCAYFKSESLASLYETAVEYTNKYDYVNDFNIVDGKLISAYYSLYDTNVKWYQISKDEEIPETIEEYQLGLVLSSKDIYFYKNLTKNEDLSFTKKIFINEFYDLTTKSIDKYLKSFLKKRYENMDGKKLVITNEQFYQENNIQKFHVIKSFKINKNIISISSKNFEIDLVGHYKEQLEEIKISEYTEDNIIYGEYDYQKFCEMFF